MTPTAEVSEHGRRVLLSFGLGRLHFVQATDALVEQGVDIEVAQGVVLRTV